jgi:hypothetical protein
MQTDTFREVAGTHDLIFFSIDTQESLHLCHFSETSLFLMRIMFTIRNGPTNKKQDEKERAGTTSHQNHTIDRACTIKSKNGRFVNRIFSPTYRH